MHHLLNQALFAAVVTAAGAPSIAGLLIGLRQACAVTRKPTMPDYRKRM